MATAVVAEEVAVRAKQCFMMMVLLLSLLMVIGVACLIVGLALLVYYQKWFLYLPQAGFNYRINPYHPQKAEDAPKTGKYAVYRSPEIHDIDYEELFLTTVDKVKIHSWFLKAEENYETAPTIVFLHGNAGSIALRLPFFSELRGELKCNIFAVEYRGYGYSEGEPSEQGLIRDVDCALSFLFCNHASQDGLKRSDLRFAARERHRELMEKRELVIDASKVFLFGRSLGGAVAVATLAIYNEHPIRGLILENTFLSIEAVLKQHLTSGNIDLLLLLEKLGMNRKRAKKCVGFINEQLVPLFLRLKWNTQSRIHMIQKPMLFLSSRKDRVVPPKHMDRLWEVFNEYTKKEILDTSRFVSFEKGGHNNTWLQSGYFQLIQFYVRECLERHS